MYVEIYVHIDVCILNFYIYVLYINMYIFVHIYIHIYIYIYIYIYVRRTFMCSLTRNTGESSSDRLGERSDIQV